MPPVFVAERDRRQSGPVEGAVVEQDAVAEMLHQLRQAMSAGATTSREMTSPSTTTPPHSAKALETVDFPAPMPPVRPMRHAPGLATPDAVRSFGVPDAVRSFGFADAVRSFGFAESETTQK